MTESEDILQERAAIMAEGNGWPQDKAERVLAWERNFSDWYALLRAVRGRG